MSSILTNTSAMVALQTLKGISGNLAKTQDEISTGKAIGSAKDNAAIWAISKTMEADVSGFKAISSSLSLGESTVAVARQASEKVTDLLTKMKEQIVAAQGENVDRVKIQTEIATLRDQIDSVVGAAQFSGLNLLNGTSSGMNVLASLDRDGGAVTASSIAVAAQDLSTGGYTASNVFSSTTGAGVIATAGDAFVTAIDGAGGADDFTISNAGTWAVGDKVSITIGNRTATYTVGDNDIGTGTSTDDLVAVGLKNAIDALGIDGLTVEYDSGSPGELAFTNDGAASLTVSAQFQNAGSGGLSLLSNIDVTTNASGALSNIEALLTTSIDAAASFGSAQGRLGIQADFISQLTDSMRSGIGSLVDANMEEASARLQALQVQQQLAVQSLSIANQAPQSILSLFR